jgi:hypothetical protein
MSRVSMEKSYNENVQVCMNATHSRKQGKTTVDRAFSLVINGVLISSLLLSSLTLMGCQTANGEVSAKTPVTVVQQVNSGIVDEQAYILNLSMAIKAINATISNNKWSVNSLDNLCKSLGIIEKKVNAEVLKSNVDLIDVIKEADEAVNGVDITKISNIVGLKEKHIEAVDTIKRIKSRLEIKDEQVKASIEVKETAPKEAKSKAVTFTTDDSEATKPTNATKVVVKATKDIAVKPVEASVVKAEVKATPAIVEVPTKYKGYTKVSARLATVNSTETIYVKYGKHTYGCRNQEEYDKSLAKVEEAVANAEKLLWGKEQEWDYTQTMNKVKYSTYPKDSREYNRLKFFQGTYGKAVNGLSPTNSKNFIMGGLVWSHLANDAKDPEDGSPNSSYSILFENKGDCDAYAHLSNAVYDVMDYSTRVTMPSTIHATADVKIEKYWLSCDSKNPVNPNPVANTILVAPTF